MATQPLTVALFQLTSIDDSAINEAEIFSRLEEVRSLGGASLMVLPENSLYLRLDRQASVKGLELTDPVLARLSTYCRQHHCEILMTTPLRENGRLVNATLRLRGEATAEVVYRKIHLFDVDVEGAPPVRESDEFVPGTTPAMIEVAGWKVGLSICYDLRFAELYHRYGKAQVDLIAVPAAFLVPTGRAHWEILLRARAIENQAYVLAPAQGGTHRSKSGASRETWGHSMIVGPWGEILAEAKSENPPRVLRMTLNPTQIETVRRQIPQAGHRRLS